MAQARPQDGLNDQQRAAVEFEGGPFAVLAGPGTGKTRVITHRVARLVERGAAPGSVVALTYTTKAARQLRERLADRIGSAAAEAVRAFTFHGFGYRLIHRFKDRLGLPPQIRLVDPPRIRRLLRELIVEHNLYREIAAQGVASAIESAVGVIGSLANNGMFPEDAAAFCDRWRSRLDGAKPDDIEAAAQRARLAEFARHVAAYAHLARACISRGWLTFDDLILHPVRLLRADKGVADICRAEWRHVVVDEFQDVNAAQIELLRLLCPPEGRPDLCVVGDDDQSIYEFRGADDRALAKFDRIWGSGEHLPLSENYRSEEPIIEVANAIMSRADDRFAPDKVVQLPSHKRGQPPRAGAAVEGVTIDDDTQAGPTIAAMLLADRAAGNAPWTRYAVIARNHLDLDRIGAALEIEGIPVRRSRSLAAAEDQGVQDVLRWVEVLAAHPDDPEVTLAARWLLTRPPWAVPSAVATEWTRLYLAARAKAAAPGFIQWLALHPEITGERASSVAAMASLRETLATTTAPMRADAAVFEIVVRCDVAHADMLGGRARAERISNLADMMRFVRGHADALDPPRDLASFWRYYAELTDKEQEMRSAAEDPVDGDAPERAEDPDAVLLLTAHSSKGLEFDTVFVAKVRPRGFPGDDRAEDDLPAGLVDRAGDGRDRRARHAAEERRLFYVACTRAERRLVLLAAARKSRTKAVDYFNELTLDPPGNRVVVRRTQAEVMAAAAAAGVKLAALGPVVEPSPGRLSRDEVLAHAQRGARQLAAQALEAAGIAGATPAMLEDAERAMRDAAERMAVISSIRQTGRSPAWAAGPLAEYGRRLADAAARGDREGASIVGPIRPPLELSFTTISEYEKCPRCYYLRRILKFPEPSDSVQIVGQVVHDALAAFALLIRDRESLGRRRPGLEELLELGRARFADRAAEIGPGQEHQLLQLLAQLRIWHEKLHDPRDEIEQVEHPFVFPYAHTRPGPDGSPVTTEHRITAKIDRLDRLPGPGAGHRIVDYKTGSAYKSYLEPAADDLQLGIYAMAVARHQSPDAPVAPKGTAEYWVLSIGERGIIDLSKLNFVKIKARIDAAIEGMLSGNFPAGKECWGLCAAVL